MLFRVIRDDGTILSEKETLTGAMNDLLALRCDNAYWYESENHPTDVITMQVTNGTFYKIQKIQKIG